MEIYHVFDSVTDEFIGIVYSINKPTAPETAKELFPSHPQLYVMSPIEYFTF